MDISSSVANSLEGTRLCVRLLRSGIGLIVVVSLSGCDALLDAAIDCLDGDRPQFNRSSLPNPILNQTYREVIQASIRNEPYDDRFVYDFTFSGSLPAGLVTEVSHRNVLVIGTPTVTGTFTLGLNVRVSLPASNSFGQSDNGLCSTVRDRSFVLNVQSM